MMPPFSFAAFFAAFLEWSTASILHAAIASVVVSVVACFTWAVLLTVAMGLIRRLDNADRVLWHRHARARARMRAQRVREANARCQLDAIARISDRRQS